MGGGAGDRCWDQGMFRGYVSGYDSGGMFRGIMSYFTCTFGGMLRGMFRGSGIRVPFSNLGPPKIHKPICVYIYTYAYTYMSIHTHIYIYTPIMCLHVHISLVYLQQSPGCFLACGQVSKLQTYPAEVSQKGLMVLGPTVNKALRALGLKVPKNSKPPKALNPKT